MPNNYQVHDQIMRAVLDRRRKQVLLKAKAKAKRSEGQIAGLPRVCVLFGFILDRKTRKEVLEPLIDDLRLDIAEAKKYRTKRSNRWLKFAFRVRVVLLMISCFNNMLADRWATLLRWLIVVTFLQLF